MGEIEVYFKLGPFKYHYSGNIFSVPLKYGSVPA
jgi:hypothetical protein